MLSIHCSFNPHPRPRQASTASPSQECGVPRLRTLSPALHLGPAHPGGSTTVTFRLGPPPPASILPAPCLGPRTSSSTSSTFRLGAPAFVSPCLASATPAPKSATHRTDAEAFSPDQDSFRPDVRAPAMAQEASRHGSSVHSSDRAHYRGPQERPHQRHHRPEPLRHPALEVALSTTPTSPEPPVVCVPVRPTGPLGVPESQPRRGARLRVPVRPPIEGSWARGASVGHPYTPTEPRPGDVAGVSTTTRPGPRRPTPHSPRRVSPVDVTSVYPRPETHFPVRP